MALFRLTTLIGTLCLSFSASALDLTRLRVAAVDLSTSSATLYTHESVLLGLSCKSGPVGHLQGGSIVKHGDTIAVGGKSFRVGVIEATLYNEDVKMGEEVIAKKGEIVCVLAPNEKSLPYNDDCNAIWVNVRNCRIAQ